MVTDKGNSWNETWTLNNEIKWSSCTKLAPSVSWIHGLIAQLVRASEQNSVAAGSNPTQVNFLQLLLKSFNGEYHIYHPATNMITCARFCLKQMWQLAKAMVEMKHKHWAMKWNWSSCTKLTLSGRWTHGLIAQSVRASELSEYHIYRFIPLLTWLPVQGFA